MNDSVLNDRQSVFYYTLAIALIYTGCDLVSITPRDRNVEFVILCPRFDYDDYRREFEAGEMAVSDVKAFGKTYQHVSRLVRDARRDGCYINPDFEGMLRDEEKP